MHFYFVNLLYSVKSAERIADMETYVIELTNQKAYKLLKELEDLNLIRVIKSSTNVSSLRKKIKTRISNEDIDNQLKAIRR